VENENAADEDWELLLSFFPSNWRSLARLSGALKGLRQDKSEEKLIRTLLLHIGCGYSMRETVVRAQQADLARLSAVALLKRLRKSKEWLYELCSALWKESGLNTSSQRRFRLIDATVVKELGATGSQWRIHYSFQWPTLACDFFRLSSTRGNGNGESLQYYPIHAQELILADRGYCRAAGIHYVASKNAFVSVRLHPGSTPLQNADGSKFELLEHIESIKTSGQLEAWDVRVPLRAHAALPVRLCVIRKSQAATTLCVKKLKHRASKLGKELQADTLRYAPYVMVLSTFRPEDFTPQQILDAYRFRWQIELVFKRFKQIAQLGYVPKYDPESAKAWLYGKLFVALLTEKLVQHARSVSPWGYDLPGSRSQSQPMA
jgi:hypothetical protein